MDYETLKNDASAELTEKRSRFIARAARVESDGAAVEFIAKVKADYPDARHHVYAYVLRENNYKRYSDDGEPQGTAGLPVLDVIERGGLTDTVIVVTRYFGGVLLGTGGLVRAYSEAAKLAVFEAGRARMTECEKLLVTVSYRHCDGIIRLISADENITRLDALYEEKALFTLALPEYAIENFAARVNEYTSGEGLVERLGEKIFMEK